MIIHILTHQVLPSAYCVCHILGRHWRLKEKQHDFHIRVKDKELPCGNAKVGGIPRTTPAVGWIFMSSAQEGSKGSKMSLEGFPGGAVVKNPPANAGDTGSSPGPGRSHMPRSN